MRYGLVILTALVAATGGCAGTPDPPPYPVTYPDRSGADAGSGDVRVAGPAASAERASAGTGPAAAPPATMPATQTMPATADAPSVAIPAEVFQVNDKFIGLKQVLHGIRAPLRAAAAGASESSFRARAQVLIHDQVRLQVERTMLLGEAGLRMTDDDKKRIDDEVKKRQLKAVTEIGSLSLFSELLKAEGSDLETWQNEVRSNLTLQAYGRDRFGSRLHVTSQMMWKYYTANREKFRGADSVQMQVIALPFRGFLPTSRKAAEDDWAEARRAAGAALALAAAALEKGESFADVAKRHSRDAMAGEGGVWPIMGRGSFRATAVEEAAFVQAVGQISKPIETAEGLYLVKTLAVQKGQDVPFEKAQEQIEYELRQQQYQGMAEEYMRKLAAQAVIVGADRFERAAVEAAARLYLK